MILKNYNPVAKLLNQFFCREKNNFQSLPHTRITNEYALKETKIFKKNKIQLQSKLIQIKAIQSEKD